MALDDAISWFIGQASGSYGPDVVYLPAMDTSIVWAFFEFTWTVIFGVAVVLLLLGAYEWWRRHLNGK